jgi:hypothetical protein
VAMSAAAEGDTPANERRDMAKPRAREASG